MHNSRENNYNIIRFLSALMVIYGHMYVLLGLNAPIIFGNGIHSIGFKILMIIGGYMITTSCLKDSKALNYIIKRCFRIFPALIFYSIIMIVVVGPILSSYGFKAYFSNSVTWMYFKNILLYPVFMLTGVFENNIYPYAVNGSLWALPVEFSLYILTYLILRVFRKEEKRRKAWIIITLLICIIQILHLALFLDKNFVFAGTDWLMALNIYPYFLIGGLYSIVNIKKYCNLQIASLLLLIGCCLSFNQIWQMELVLMLVMPYFIISLGEAHTPIFSKCFENIDLTYGLFLWGFPVQQTLINVIYVRNQEVLSANVYFFVTLVSTLALAMITWYCVEKPASTAMKMILKKMN